MLAALHKMPESTTLPWHAPTLGARLRALWPGLDLEVVAGVESTNSVLVDRARRAADTPACLLVAEHQSAGRGRLGRSWQSARGASLTFSLALPCAPPDWSGLSLAVGVALADALDPMDSTQAPRIGLKWPNDLWLLGAPGEFDAAPQKLGGVLIETVPIGERRMCIVGVGLNVLPQAHDDLASGFACLHQLDRTASAPGALALVAEPLLRALQRFEREGFSAFEAAYTRRDLLRGRDVTTTLPALPEGRAEGVDGRGALLVRDRGGALHRLVGGEISVRPASVESR